MEQDLLLVSYIVLVNTRIPCTDPLHLKPAAAFASTSSQPTNLRVGVDRRLVKRRKTSGPSHDDVVFVESPCPFPPYSILIVQSKFLRQFRRHLHLRLLLLSPNIAECSPSSSLSVFSRPRDRQCQTPKNQPSNPRRQRHRRDPKPRNGQTRNSRSMIRATNPGGRDRSRGEGVDRISASEHSNSNNRTRTAEEVEVLRRSRWPR